MVKATKAKPSHQTNQENEEDVVYEYLQRQNRPFGANDIFQNLHGTIGKTAITKLLTSMADKGKITAKTFGKSVIYFPNQGESEALSEEEAKQMDQDIEQAKVDLESIKTKVQAQQKVVQSLKSSLTTDEIRDRIRALESENTKYEARLESLNQGGEKVDPEARQKLEDTLKKYKLVWQQKKGLVKDCVDLITEQMDKKPKVFMEEIGIETDEMLGCDLVSVFDVKRALLPE